MSSGPKRLPRVYDELAFVRFAGAALPGGADPEAVADRNGLDAFLRPGDPIDGGLFRRAARRDLARGKHGQRILHRLAGPWRRVDPEMKLLPVAAFFQAGCPGGEDLCRHALGHDLRLRARRDDPNVDA